MDQHQSAPGPTQTAAVATASHRSFLASLPHIWVIAYFDCAGLVNPVKHFQGVAVYISPFSTWDHLGNPPRFLGIPEGWDCGTLMGRTHLQPLFYFTSLFFQYHPNMIYVLIISQIREATKRVQAHSESTCGSAAPNSWFYYKLVRKLLWVTMPDPPNITSQIFRNSLEIWGAVKTRTTQITRMFFFPKPS